MRSTLLVVVVPALALVGAAGCSEPQPAVPTDAANPTAQDAPKPAPSKGMRDANAIGSVNTPLLDGGAPSDSPRIGAMFMETPIMSDMELPDPQDRGRRRGRGAPNADGKEEVIRLGYLRHGSSAPVIPEPHVKPNCLEGWYELVAGGFVCGKHATLDLRHPRVRLAPHPPDVTAALPYHYGYNLTNGTPLYRQIPSKKDRLRFEPWLSPKPKPKLPPPAEESDNPYVVSTDEPPSAASMLAGLAVASTRDPLGLGIDEDAGTPWYLRDMDGGKPQITLDELRGEGPIMRRMVKGFFVALDKEMKVNNVRWWRTTAGHVVPYERLYVHKPPTDFHGIWLKEGAPPWPPSLTPGSLRERAGSEKPAPASAVAAAVPPFPDDAGPEDGGVKKAGNGNVVFMWNAKGKRYAPSTFSKRGKVTSMQAGEVLPWRIPLKVTGEVVNVSGIVFEEVDDGSWVRSGDVIHTRPGPPPEGLLPGEKWIDVNLENQTLVAFEGTTPVFATLTSSGKKDEEDKEKDHRTPPGTYRIWAKHIAATMDGDVASDGPYSIEDVPWIMYFKGNYALHGAFWHGGFGRERSHGCVNLAPADARALFGWTDPPLPEGWHGLRATDSNPGTRVIVRDREDRH